MKLGIFKFLRILFSLVILFTLIPIAQVLAAATNVNLLLLPATGTLNANDTVTVTVQAQAASQNVTAIDCNLNFDPIYLSVQLMTPGTALASVNPPAYDNVAGTASFNVGNLGAPATGTFTVGTIIFQVKRVVDSGIAVVSFSSSTTVDYLGTKITGTLTGASYTINVPDTTPPTVQSTAPANGTTMVPVNSKMAVTFSKPMNTASTQKAFSINPGVVGNFSWNPAGTVMTFTPASDLVSDTTYNVNIGTTATDNASPPNPLASAYAFSFTTLSPPPIIMTTSPLPVATFGTEYNQTLAATGGVAPYTWTLNTGSVLPTGLSLSPGGVISGIPALAGGPTDVTFKVTDVSSPPQTATKTLSISINRAVPAFSGLSSPTINRGNTPTVLGGMIASGSLYPTGNISITLNSKTQDAAIQSDGTFSASFDTSSLTVAGSPYTINYRYDGNSNFNSISDNSKTLTVAAQNTFTIKATVTGGNGSVTVDTANVILGGTATVFMNPDSGYDIGSITDTVNGVTINVPITKPYVIPNVTADHVVVVTFSRMYAITTSAGPGGTISPFSLTDNWVGVMSGYNQPFTIIPYPGYSISDVTVDGVSVKTALVNNTYTLTNVNADHTVIAAFTPSGGEASFKLYENTSSLTAATDNTGVGIWAAQTFTPKNTHTVTLIKLQMDNDRAVSGNVTNTLTVSLKATKADGSPTGPDLVSKTIDEASLARNYNIYSFDLGSGYLVQAGKTYAICMHATFDSPSIKVFIAPDGAYAGGSYFTGGANFNGESWSPKPTYDIWFEEWGTQTQYTVTASVNGGNGTVSPAAQSIVSGANATVTITPNTGYHPSALTDNGANVALSQVINNQYTINAVTANHNLVATFAANPCSLTTNTSPSGGGTVTVNTAGPYHFGQTVTLTASAAKNYTFSGWGGTATGTTNPLQFTFSGDSSITATFTYNAPTPTPPPTPAPVYGGGGWVAPPTNTAITLAGLTGDKSLIVDGSGLAQGAVQLKNTDGSLALDIAVNTALLDTSRSPLKTLSASPVSSLTGPSPDVLILAYSFGPDGALFKPALTLTLKYDIQKLPSNADENKLYIALWDGSSWTKLDSTVDSQSKTVTAGIDHFSNYALIATVPPPPPAKFTLSNLTVTPASANPGDTVSIQTTVSNTGGSPGTYSVLLNINGQDRDVRVLNLSAGQTATANFNATQNAPGIYSVDVNGNKAQFTVAAPAVKAPTSTTPTITRQPAPAPTTPTPEEVKVSAATSASPSSTPDNTTGFSVVWIILAVLSIAIIAFILIFSQRTTK